MVPRTSSCVITWSRGSYHSVAASAAIHIFCLRIGVWMLHRTKDNPGFNITADNLRSSASSVIFMRILTAEPYAGNYQRVQFTCPESSRCYSTEQLQNLVPSAYVACTHWLDTGGFTWSRRGSDSPNPLMVVGTHSTRLIWRPLKTTPLQSVWRTTVELTSFNSQILALATSEGVYCGTIRLRQIESRGNGKKRLIPRYGKFYRGVLFERQYEDLSLASLWELFISGSPCVQARYDLLSFSRTLLVDK